MTIINSKGEMPYSFDFKEYLVFGIIVVNIYYILVCIKCILVELDEFLILVANFLG